MGSRAARGLATLAVAVLFLGGCDGGSPSAGPPSADASASVLDGPSQPAADGGGTGSNCWAEDPPGATPATPECSSLPYATQMCPGAGGAASKSPGLVICEWYRPILKTGAFKELVGCLTALPGGDQACSPATDFAAFDCFVKLQKGREDCLAAPVAVEGQTLGCKELVDTCTTNTAEMKDLTLSFCNARLNPFSTEGRRMALACYRASAASLCNTRLNRCTQPPVQ